MPTMCLWCTSVVPIDVYHVNGNIVSLVASKLIGIRLKVLVASFDVIALYFKLGRLYRHILWICQESRCYFRQFYLFWKVTLNLGTNKLFMLSLWNLNYFCPYFSWINFEIDIHALVISLLEFSTLQIPSFLSPLLNL